MSEPSLRAGPAGVGGGGARLEKARNGPGPGRGAPVPAERRPGGRGGQPGARRRSGARRRAGAASELSRGSGGRGAGAAARLGAGAGAARLRGGQLLRQTFRGGLRLEAALNHGGFDRSTPALLPFRAGKVKLFQELHVHLLCAPSCPRCTAQRVLAAGSLEE